MVKKLYAIYDSKSSVHLPPWLAHNDGDAMRQCMAMLEKEDNMISRFSADYNLVNLGSYDDVKGLIEGLNVPKMITNISELLNKDVTND